MSGCENGGSGPDIKAMLSHILPADSPPMNIMVENSGQMPTQQLLDAIINIMVEENIGLAEYEENDTEERPPLTCWERYKQDVEASGKTIDRDPFEQFKFAEKLIDYESDLLEVCWSMRERLEQAADYVSGVPAWKILLEQSVELTARLQQLAAALADLGRDQKKEAKRLMDLMAGDLSSVM